MKSLNLKLASVITLLLASPALLSAQDEAAQLALLEQAGATLEQKQNACRDLALVGTAKSVPVLAGLLGDAELSHMARYALEPIPAPEVDTALREALGTVQGRQRLGVIDSIGGRRDKLATPALTKLLGDPDAEVARSAARALGEIGTPRSLHSLHVQLTGASPNQLQAVCDGLFRAAEPLTGRWASEGGFPIYRLREQLPKGGENGIAIYKHLLVFPKSPQHVRTAALRGAVRADRESGLNPLVAVLRGDDEAMFSAAVGIAMERRDARVTAVLAMELAELPAERQILVIGALAQQGDPVGAPAVMTLLDSAGTPVRVAAVKALTRLAHVPAVPVLAKLALAEEGELTSTARDCLASFPDLAADAAIAEFLASTDPEVRRLGVELIGLRAIDVAVPALLKAAATDQDETVCVAALTVLRELAGTSELEALVQILLKTESEVVRKSVTHALVVVCAREPALGSEPSAACVDPLVAALEKSSGPARQALLQVLGRVGGTTAREAVRAATGQSDGEE